MKVCRYGHEWGGDRRCLPCHVNAQARYEKTEKGRAAWTRYRQTPKGRARSRANGRRNYLAHKAARKAATKARHWRCRADRLAKMKEYSRKAGGNGRMQFWLRQERNAL